MTDALEVRAAPASSTAAEDEDARLAEFGYTQRLDRSVGRLASFAIGFSTISATTAVFSGFGAGYSTAGAPFVWTLLLAVAVFGLWALIAADLAAKIPLAGYAYQWTSRINGSGLGWFTGYTALIGWVSGLTGVGYVFAGYFASVVGWDTGARGQIFLTMAVVAVCIVINVYGVRVATALNNVGVGLELVVTVAATVVVAVIALSSSDRHQPLHVLFTGGTHDGHGSYAAAWLAASLGPFFGLIGVEAGADVAEETKGARRVVPRTMLYALVVSAAIELAMYIIYVLAIRDHASVVASSSAPIEEILRQQIGSGATKIVVAVALTNILACLLANILVSTRLTYSMARDNMLPFSSLLRIVTPRHRSPVVAVAAIGLASVALLASALVSATAFTYLLGICTLGFFSVYILQTAGLILARRNIPAPEPGTFDLGRYRLAVYVVGLVVFAAVAAALVLLPQFAGNGWVFLGVVAAGALWYVAVLRRRIASGRAGRAFADTRL